MLSKTLLANAALAGLVAAAPVKQLDNSYSSNEVSRINMYQPFYTKLERYAVFSSASGSSYCSNPPYGSSVQNYINIDSTDTQATLFRDDIAKEFILAFPGTNGRVDEKYDGRARPTAYYDTYRGNCTDCAVHTGFYQVWQSAAPYTRQVVDEALAQNPNYNLTITGYSLGGALANLAYVTFKSHKKYPVANAFTYGQPRVGNQHYADFVDELSGATENTPGEMHRMTHAGDGIPQVPGTAAGYRHSRTEYFEANPQGAGNTYRCHGQEADDCSKKYGHGYINQAHFYYSGISMIDGAQCEGATG